jgi:hypothetical protein
MSTLPTFSPSYVDGVTTVQPVIVFESPATTVWYPDPGRGEPAGRVSKLPFVNRLAGAAPAVAETMDMPARLATPIVTSEAATVTRDLIHRSVLVIRAP